MTRLHSLVTFIGPVDACHYTTLRIVQMLYYSVSLNMVEYNIIKYSKTMHYLPKKCIVENARLCSLMLGFWEGLLHTRQ